MVFVYFVRDSDGLEAAAAVAARRKKCRSIGVFLRQALRKKPFAQREAQANVSDLSKEVQSPQPVKNRPIVVSQYLRIHCPFSLLHDIKQASSSDLHSAICPRLTKQ
jgi:hypothetical protein